MIRFNDQRWRLGSSDCSLSVRLALSDATPHWTLQARATLAGAQQLDNELVLSVGPLPIRVRDWRELQGQQIDVNPAWQDAHEFVNEDGEVEWTQAEVRVWPDRTVQRAWYWLCDSFQLRFGSWDGNRIVCDFEGRFEAETDYFCDPPEYSGTRHVTAHPLLLMAQATLKFCEVEVPREVSGAEEWARARAARELGLRHASVRPVADQDERRPCRVVLHPIAA